METILLISSLNSSSAQIRMPLDFFSGRLFHLSSLYFINFNNVQPPPKILKTILNQHQPHNPIPDPFPEKYCYTWLHSSVPPSYQPPFPSNPNNAASPYAPRGHHHFYKLPPEQICRDRRVVRWRQTAQCLVLGRMPWRWRGMRLGRRFRFLVCTLRIRVLFFLFGGGWMDCESLLYIYFLFLYL